MVSFEIQQFCANAKTPLYCTVRWASNDSVEALGPYVPGNFTPNPGFTGPGVLLGFGVPSVLQWVTFGVSLGVIVAHWRRDRVSRRNSSQEELTRLVKLPWESKEDRLRLLKAYRTYVLATSDSQTFLAMAYGLNFYLSGKCTLSAYHFNVAVNLGLIVCSNFVLSTLMVRNYWKTPYSAGLRHACILVVFVFLGWMLGYQVRQPHAPEWEPPWTRRTSAILLPISCFLDPEIHDFDNLTSAQTDQIGSFQRPSMLPEFGLFVMTTLWFGLGFTKSVLLGIFDRGKNVTGRVYPYKLGMCILAYQLVALISLLITTIFAWRHILTLKQWVSSFGWMQQYPGGGNPEDDYNSGIGQLYPILALIMIPIIILSQWEHDSHRGYGPVVNGSGVRGRGQSIHMGPLIPQRGWHGKQPGQEW